MKTLAIALLCVVSTCTNAYAVVGSLFSDLDSYVENMTDIVVVQCVSVEQPKPPLVAPQLWAIDVEIRAVLKGGRKLGPLTVSTLDRLGSGTTYLLATEGGRTAKTDFIVSSELSVVPIPAGFDLGSLKGLTTGQAVEKIFARRLDEVNRKVAALRQEQTLLKRALPGRKN